MTKAEREQVRKRIAAATPGPWFVYDSIRCPKTFQLPNGQLGLEDEEPRTFAWQIVVEESDGYSIVHGGGWHSQGETLADIDFAAAARTDLPATLDDVDRLLTTVKQLLDDPYDVATTRARALVKELES